MAVALAAGAALLVVGVVLMLVAGLSSAGIAWLAGGILAITGGLGRLYAWPMPSSTADIARRSAALNSTAMSQDSR